MGEVAVSGWSERPSRICLQEPRDKNQEVGDTEGQKKKRGRKSGLGDYPVQDDGDDATAPDRQIRFLFTHCDCQNGIAYLLFIKLPPPSSAEPPDIYSNNYTPHLPFRVPTFGV